MKQQQLHVGILGATGMVGQQYIHLLENHPWFTVTFLAASERSAGKTFADAVAGRWHAQGDMPQKIRNMRVHTVDDIRAAKESCSFVFSALDSEIAKIYESQYARAGIPVVSNASAHRQDPDVPMLIPEINADHIAIIPLQQRQRGWNKGFIAVKPNCSLQSYLTPLYALHQKYRVKQVIVSTMQAVSGAGHPGVASLDIIDNVVPFINGEEEKTEQEPLKIWGQIEGNAIIPSQGICIAAHCNRVPTLNGHLACVSVSFANKPTKEEIISAWKSFRGMPQELKLPMAPEHPIIYRDEPDRPQVRLDRDADKGMATTVGRLRECPVLDWRFVGLSHNTIRGAAGGGILNAELLVAKGFIL
ncbi:aspartate-semialdehyde dehydrogenase [Candidatus Woesearchaeota archaeon]|nr:aspartate-semialdehyde dehydrogenase [Candidatus Woesearchaeota archaeon]